MPRGGFRAGGGRPKGAKDAKPRVRKAKPKSAPTLDAGGPPNEDPMAYMRRIMNDPAADVGRRDRMALALAGLQVQCAVPGPLRYLGD
jgi:hypothetical protein